LTSQVWFAILRLMNNAYPKIEMKKALLAANGNQAELGRMLGYKRAYINNLVKTDKKYLPESAAWRFVDRCSDNRLIIT
jgi:hypothetical protein